MKMTLVNSSSRRAIFLLAGLLVLGGCASVAKQFPFMPSPAVHASSALDRTHSWMAREASSDDLLYISDGGGVHIFSYPKGTPVGEIKGFMSPEGLCSDRAGNVFVTDSIVGRVWEFAHGGTKPVRYFNDIYVDFAPYDCSVDPTTRNLAVASQDSGFVVIFPNEQNTPEVYYDPYALMFHCAYDATGNLYDDLVIYRHREYIGVLRKGSQTFKNFLLDGRAGIPGALQFDGQHVVANDLNTNVLHQLNFSGSNATVIGSTPLNGAKQIEQFWIHKGKAIGPDLYGTVYYWNYPVGGSPIHSISGFTDPVGSTISATL
jgi:hypothetical protein